MSRVSSLSDPSLYIPKDWHLTPIDITLTPCLSYSKLLRVFAYENLSSCVTWAIITYISYYLSYRHVIIQRQAKAGNTTGIFDRVVSFTGSIKLNSGNNQRWIYQFIGQIFLHFMKNYVVARVTLSNPSYEHTFTVGNLMLFYLAIPRLTWLVPLAFSFYKTKQILELGDATEMHSVKIPSHGLPTEEPERKSDVVERPFMDRSMKILAVELLLPIFNFFPILHAHKEIIKKAKRGRKHTFPRGARLFEFGGDMFLALTVIQTVVVCGVAITLLLGKMKLSSKFRFLNGFLFCSYMLSWIFFAGYFQLAAGSL